MGKLAKQINIAVYWYECVINEQAPYTLIDWESVSSQFDKADDKPDYIYL